MLADAHRYDLPNVAHTPKSFAGNVTPVQDRVLSMIERQHRTLPRVDSLGSDFPSYLLYGFTLHIAHSARNSHMLMDTVTVLLHVTAAKSNIGLLCPVGERLSTLMR
jgi:hypothetical protein